MDKKLKPMANPPIRGILLEIKKLYLIANFLNKNIEKKVNKSPPSIIKKLLANVADSFVENQIVIAILSFTRHILNAKIKI